MAKVSIFSEFWDFMKVRKKILVGANYCGIAATGNSDSVYPKFGFGSVYLCFVLNLMRVQLCKLNPR